MGTSCDIYSRGEREWSLLRLLRALQSGLFTRPHQRGPRREEHPRVQSENRNQSEAVTHSHARARARLISGPKGKSNIITSVTFDVKNLFFKALKQIQEIKMIKKIIKKKFYSKSNISPNTMLRYSFYLLNSNWELNPYVNNLHTKSYLLMNDLL